MLDPDQWPRTEGYSRQNSQGSDISQKQLVKPTVHYPEELDRAPSAQYFNTPPKLESRAPSFAGTDEDGDGDGDEFDLSGDEDLADEEAKFGQQMGVNLRARRWTFWRFVCFSYAKNLPKRITLAACSPPCSPP